MAFVDEEGDDVDPFTILPGEKEEEGAAVAVGEDANTRMMQQQQHYLSSINSRIIIRQLPSQGLSFQLWPAATTLVTLLDQHQHQLNNSPLSPILVAFSDDSQRRPLRILELGSGTGLVGITAAATLGANVTVTDLPHVLSNLQFNVDANSNALTLHGGTVNVASLRWGVAEDMESIGCEFDLLLASDVVYHDHLFDPLLQTLKFFLNGENNMEFLMAHLKRWKKDSIFFRKARKLFHVDMIHTDPPSPGFRIGVAVYRFTRKFRDGMPVTQKTSVQRSNSEILEE